MKIRYQTLTKNRTLCARFRHAISGLADIMVAGFLITSSAEGAIIWNGPTITFTNLAGTDPTQPTNQDRITPDVWITRGNSQGIYNIEAEPSFQHFFSPSNTEWADGTTANYLTLTYTNWNTWVKIVHSGPPSTVGTNAVVHLIADDIYIDIQFTSWPVGSGFSYIRSTPSVAPAASILTGPTLLGGGTVQFTFTNTPGYNFTVLGTTNLLLPLTNWTVLGQATYAPAGPGSYQFTDPGAGTNQPQRFYLLRWP